MIYTRPYSTVVSLSDFTPAPLAITSTFSTIISVSLSNTTMISMTKTQEERIRLPRSSVSGSSPCRSNMRGREQILCLARQFWTHVMQWLLLPMMLATTNPSTAQKPLSSHMTCFGKNLMSSGLRGGTPTLLQMLQTTRFVFQHFPMLSTCFALEKFFLGLWKSIFRRLS